MAEKQLLDLVEVCCLGVCFVGRQAASRLPHSDQMVALLTVGANLGDIKLHSDLLSFDFPRQTARLRHFVVNEVLGGASLACEFAAVFLLFN